MNVLVTGGAKNGKSHYAQELARDMALELSVPLYYVATMIPHDEEDHARIKRHIREREGWGFDTIEQGTDIIGCLSGEKQTAAGVIPDSKGVFLLDATTSLLANEMFREDGTFDKDAGRRVAAELVEFAAKTGNTVFVSDYIYSDARHFDEMTEAYRKALADIDRALAKVCDRVVEVSFGTRTEFK